MFVSWQESYDKPRQNRDITLLTKVHIVKAMVFPVVLSGCESWIVKWSARRIDAFELWCWRRLLKVPWTARRSNESILREINPEYLLEGLMLKLKLQCFGHLMWTADTLEKSLVLGGIEGRRRRGHQRMRWLDGITDALDMTLGKLQERWGTGRPGMLQSMQFQRVRHNWVTEQHYVYACEGCLLIHAVGLLLPNKQLFRAHLKFITQNLKWSLQSSQLLQETFPTFSLSGFVFPSKSGKQKHCIHICQFCC